MSVIRYAPEPELDAAAIKRVTGTLLCCFALLVWSASTVKAGQYEDAIAAAKNGDYSTALTLLRPLAKKGNADAQNALGRMYLIGLGVAQDSMAAAGREMQEHKAISA